MDNKNSFLETIVLSFLFVIFMFLSIPIMIITGGIKSDKPAKKIRRFK